jgi:hypothetical protein
MPTYSYVADLSEDASPMGDEQGIISVNAKRNNEDD